MQVQLHYLLYITFVLFIHSYVNKSLTIKLILKRTREYEKEQKSLEEINYNKIILNLVLPNNLI